MLFPNHFFLDAIIYACAGFASVIPLFSLNIRFARPLGLIDWPKARGLSDDHVPIVGPSLIVVALVTLSVLMAYFNVSPWVVTAACIIAVMGYFDDRRPLPALDKLFFQAICSVVVVYMDPQVSATLGAYGTWASPLGVFFLIGAMNAVNFIDGIDGLAGSVLLTAFAAVPLIGAGQNAAVPYAILSCVLVGAIIPFLYLNVRRRRGFLGNIGSYFFSFLAAIAHLSIPLESPDSITRLSLTALCFLVPIADACTVITVRLLSRRSPFRPDKGHLHHRLVQTNIPLRYTLLVFAGIQVLGTATCWAFSRGTLASSSYVATLVFCSYALITSTLILLLEKASRIRVQSYFQRLDAGDPIYYLKYRVDRVDKAPVKRPELERLEAKFAAEIRVTDICVAQNDSTLFIVLRTMAEPLKGISARLEAVIHSERKYEFHLIERGDFTKRSSSEPKKKTA